MAYPKELPEIARKAVDRYPSNIEKSTDIALRLIKRLPEYDDFMESLIRDAVQDIIYDIRHSDNVAMKRANGMYNIEPKVIVSNSSAVLEVFKSLYEMRNAGAQIRQRLKKDGNKKTIK